MISPTDSCPSILSATLRLVRTGGLLLLLLVIGCTPDEETLRIEAVTPQSVPQGKGLRIFGTGFGEYVAGGAGVLVGTTCATVLSWEDDAVIVEVPTGIGTGSRDVVVFCADGETVSSAVSIVGEDLPPNPNPTCGFTPGTGVEVLCVPDSCSGHGECDDSSGAIHCSCSTGYAGVACEVCAPTHVRQGESCVPSGTGMECAEPLRLLLGDVETGTTADGNMRYQGTCGGAGPEKIYAFTTPYDVSTIEIEVSGFDTVLHVREECSRDGSEVACNDDTFEDVNSRVDFRPVGGRTYYVFVDGYDGFSSGGYSLYSGVTCGSGLPFDVASQSCAGESCSPNPCTEANMHVCVSTSDGYECRCDPGYEPDGPRCVLADAGGDTCDEAIRLDLGATRTFGNTSGLGNNAMGTCGGDGRDQVYGFYIAEPSAFTVLMTADFDTLLHLRRNCETSQGEVACSDDADNFWGRIDTNLDPGEYYLWADGYSSQDVGAYTLEYSLRPLAP